MSKLAKKVKFLYSPEEKKFLSVIDSPRDRAIVKLFLECGIFTAELLNLTLEDFDFENNKLKLSGFKECNQARTININDDVKKAINEYLKTRPNCDHNKIFLNENDTKPLTKFGLYHMFEKYRKKAKLLTEVNANILRATCIIRLFTLDMSFQKIVAYLGLKSGIELRFYEREAAKLAKPQPRPIEEFDRRNKLEKIKDKIFPPLSRPTATLSPQAGQGENPIKHKITGRAWLIKEVISELKKGQSVMITGIYGLGKTSMLKEIIPEFTENMRSTKAVLSHFVELQSGKAPQKNKNAQELMTVVDKSKVLAFPFDDIDKARGDDIAMIMNTIENTPWFLTAETINKKLHFLKNRVKVYELNKLTDQNIEEIIDWRLTEMKLPPYLKDMLYKKVKITADGNPGVAHNLLDQMRRRPKIKQDDISELYDDSVTNPVDWSGAIIVLYSAILMWRYIARGTYDTETYILSGVIYALFMGMGWRGRRKS